MPHRHRRLIILGNSVTALAVARAASRLGLAVVLVDRGPGVANATRVARCRVVGQGHDDDEVLECLQLLARAKREPLLLATSDAWLRFVRRRRAELDRVFARVLHPTNEVLDVCLNKLTFARWCVDNDIPSPLACHADDERCLEGRQRPWILRPSETAHEVPAARVSKAVEVRSHEDLQEKLELYRRANVEGVVTESLLRGPITQYSVPFARTERGTVAFVARKVRPLPEHCSVGTLVQVVHHPAIEALGRRVADALDLRGIGEVEVICQEATRRHFVIEVNPRPWSQFSLARAAGLDFLGWLLGTSVPQNEPQPACWVDLTTDLYFALSRREGLIWQGKLGWGEYLSSLFHVNTFSTLDLRDPGPFLADLLNFFSFRRPHPGRLLGRPVEATGLSPVGVVPT